MDPDPPSSTPRKVSFRPKGPPRRTPKPAATSSEAADGHDANEEAQQLRLSRRANEHLAGRKSGTEKKSTVQVAFTHGVTSMGLRTYGKQRERADDRNDAAKYEESIHDDTQIVDASMSTSGSSGEDPEGSTDKTTMKEREEYQEPWNYKEDYYPVSLPWRPPYSGDPELLDKEEFENPEDYDENTIQAASELGMLEEDGKQKMIFLQFPERLPLDTKPTSTIAQDKPTSSKGKETATGNPTDTHGKKVSRGYTDPLSKHSSAKGQPLEELPEGYMGKLLVYKSGVVKMKLGDTQFDIDPATNRLSAGKVVAVNNSSGHMCAVGELKSHGVVVPDIDRLMD